MAARADIIACARGYLGVRWHHQGRSRAGLDCVGLVVAVAHDLGLSDYDIDGYGEVPDGVMMRAELGRLMLGIDPAAAQPGDVLLMRFELEPQHLAIVTDVGIVHAHAAVRRVVEHRLDELWAARVVGAYTWPGVA